MGSGFRVEELEKKLRTDFLGFCFFLLSLPGLQFLHRVSADLKRLETVVNTIQNVDSGGTTWLHSRYSHQPSIFNLNPQKSGLRI